MMLIFMLPDHQVVPILRHPDRKNLYREIIIFGW